VIASARPATRTARRRIKFWHIKGNWSPPVVEILVLKLTATQ
jgi:hypothetical protein